MVMSNKGITNERLCVCPFMSAASSIYYRQDHCKLLLTYSTKIGKEKERETIQECAFAIIAKALAE